MKENFINKYEDTKKCIETLTKPKSQYLKKKKFKSLSQITKNKEIAMILLICRKISNIATSERLITNL